MGACSSAERHYLGSVAQLSLMLSLNADAELFWSNCLRFPLMQEAALLLVWFLLRCWWCCTSSWLLRCGEGFTALSWHCAFIIAVGGCCFHGIAVSLALHWRTDCYIAVCGYDPVLGTRCAGPPHPLHSRQSLVCVQLTLCTAQVGQASFCTSLQHHTAAMQLPAVVIIRRECWLPDMPSVCSSVG